MKITSQQKKFGLPLAGFLISFIAYLIDLGTFWAIVLVAPMVATLIVFLAYNGNRIIESIRAWLERDGWE